MDTVHNHAPRSAIAVALSTLKRRTRPAQRRVEAFGYPEKAPDRGDSRFRVARSTSFSPTRFTSEKFRIGRNVTLTSAFTRCI
jgi:hypothetical protein